VAWTFHQALGGCVDAGVARPDRDGRGCRYCNDDILDDEERRLLMFRVLIEEKVSVEDIIAAYGEVIEHVLEVLLVAEGKVVGDGLDIKDVSLVLLVEEGTVIKDDIGARV
jgi:hypothetical protein